MWRGSGRFGLSVAAPFVWRARVTVALAPFPHPAQRTGRADLPHPQSNGHTVRKYHDRYVSRVVVR